MLHSDHCVLYRGKVPEALGFVLFVWFCFPHTTEQVLLLLHAAARAAGAPPPTCPILLLPFWCSLLLSGRGPVV